MQAALWYSRHAWRARVLAILCAAYLDGGDGLGGGGGDGLGGGGGDGLRSAQAFHTVRMTCSSWALWPVMVGSVQVTLVGEGSGEAGTEAPGAMGCGQQTQVKSLLGCGA